jgi:hypothetical protein
MCDGFNICEDICYFIGFCKGFINCFLGINDDYDKFVFRFLRRNFDFIACYGVSIGAVSNNIFKFLMKFLRLG